MPKKTTAKQVLGNPPWDDDRLTRAYFADFVGIHRAMQAHPGYRLHAELDQLTLSKRLFDNALLILNTAVETFRVHSLTRGFGTRNSKLRSEELTLSVQSALFQSAATAMAFQDRTRTLGARISIPQFSDQFDATFRRNEWHQFVRCLRDHLSHVAPLPAEWQLSRAGRDAPQIAKFLLYIADLHDVASRGRKWDLLARTFIARYRPSPEDTLPGSSDAIDIISLFSDYRRELEVFYNWLQHAAEASAGPDLIEYRETQTRFSRIALRIAWRAIVLPRMNASPSPRAILNTHLTDEEIAAIDTLPSGSRQQIDQIISFIDADDGFVDVEIRGAIYRKFDIDTAESVSV